MPLFNRCGLGIRQLESFAIGFLAGSTLDIPLDSHTLTSWTTCGGFTYLQEIKRLVMP